MPARNPFFEVTPAHFKNDPKYGRTTKIRETETGREIELMGAFPKGQAIEQFKKHFPDLNSEQHLLELGGSFDELPNEPLTPAERKRMNRKR